MADGPEILPSSVDLPLALSGDGSSAYDVPAGTSGTLSLQLQAGDVNVSLQNDDQSSSIQDSLSGSGSATIGLSGYQTMHLRLSSQGGAQLSLRFDPGSGLATNVVTSAGNTAISTSSSSVNVSHDVSVTGGSAGSVSGGSIHIVNGQVTVTGGQ
ncbi:MAG TPA: hypothetical protein VK009_19610 [Chloroflexota bacterium]|nr:hypothetical protein [Chloroflexota bacterium]